MFRRDFLVGAMGAGALAPAVAQGAELRDPRIADVIAGQQRPRFDGVVLVRQGGRLRHAEAVGVANVAFNAPSRLDTRYWVCSITKAFTAVLLLQLVDEGRVDPGAAIAAYLPDYAGEAARKVTVHQLLNHTSGLENIDRIPNIEDVQQGVAAALQDARAHGRLPLYQTPYTSDQLLSLFCSGPLVREPGKAFDYNNADYIVLGKIIERLRGKPYEAVLNERIIEPLGMLGSGMLRQSEIVPALAVPCSPAGDVLAYDTPVYPENWYAAGGAYATAGDVLAFSDALFGGRLLKPESLRRMLAPGLDDYGYGVWSRRRTLAGRSWTVITRPGRVMGSRSQLLHMPEADLTIVMASNTGFDLDGLSAEIAGRMVTAG